MIKRFLDWGMQDISIGVFIDVAFVTSVVTMTAYLSLLFVFDIVN